MSLAALPLPLSLPFAPRLRTANTTTNTRNDETKHQALYNGQLKEKKSTKIRCTASLRKTCGKASHTTAQITMTVHSLESVSRSGSWKVAPRVAATRPASAGEQSSRGSSAFKITRTPSVERQSKAVQVPRASDTQAHEKILQNVSESTAVSR